MSKKSATAAAGVAAATSGGGLMVPLFLIFLVLKLIGVIDWSWWWVTGPLWIPLAVILVGTLAAMGCVLVSAAWKKVRS